MEWTKIPTNLINGEFSDAEILSIIKYQLLYSLTENEPNEKILNKFLTKKQKNIAKNYKKIVSANVENELKIVQKKRNADKVRYAHSKELSTNSKTNSASEFTSGPLSQIREDKIREDNISFYSYKKEKEKEKNLISSFLKEYEKVFMCVPLIDDNSKKKIVELFENNPDDFITQSKKVFARLKNIDWTFKNGTKPKLDWLLKDSNFIKLANQDDSKCFDKERILEEFLRSHQNE